MKIIRIIRIKDTREFQEVGDDRWEPISGSGIAHQCDRCGRLHEIHATVMCEDGKPSTVGLGCAHAQDLVQASSFRVAANLFARLATLERREAKFNKLVAIWDEAMQRVLSTPMPEPIFGTGEMGDEVRIGVEGWARIDLQQLSRPHGEGARYKAERLDCAKRGWITARMQELCGMENRPHCDRDFGKLRRQILKAMAQAGLSLDEAA